jgi:signal transduction histidine kinase
VLDLSKIEAGQIDLTIEEFDLHALLTRVVDGIRPVAAINSNQVFVDLGSDLKTFKMRGDSTKVAQCVRNLLANSCKFTDHGSIQLFVRRRQDKILFRVSDTGIGMTTEQLQHVFEEYFQVELTVGRQFGGSGLGLAICRRLCRRMGGDVTAQSRSGTGSAFTMELPAVCPEGATADAADAVKLAS